MSDASPVAPSTGIRRSTGDVPLRAGDPVDVDGYLPISLLGTGGTADVFHALAPGGRQVALKVFRSPVDDDACRREFDLAAMVRPECTAEPLGHGVSDSGPYLVSAYLPGYRCGRSLTAGAISPDRLRTLGRSLARVLHATHVRGVVHCDVKPANLLIRGDDVRLIDFGIARRVGEPCGQGGHVQCSRGWASPEQLRSAPATPAVDVFAWGCLMGYLAAGVHPFASRTQAEWILRVQSAQPDLSGLPAVLDEVVSSALARDPADRPTARDLVTACTVRDDRRPAPHRRGPAPRAVVDAATQPALLAA